MFSDIVVTAALEGSVLPGVTRDSIIHILKDMGYKVEVHTGYILYNYSAGMLRCLSDSDQFM